jgi:hypothetical protein
VGHQLPGYEAKGFLSHLFGSYDLRGQPDSILVHGQWTTLHKVPEARRELDDLKHQQAHFVHPDDVATAPTDCSKI